VIQNKLAYTLLTNDLKVAKLLNVSLLASRLFYLKFQNKYLLLVIVGSLLVTTSVDVSYFFRIFVLSVLLLFMYVFGRE